MPRTLALLAALVLHFGAGTARGQILSYSSTIDPADPLQTGRILRNGTPSVAGTPKPFPGLNDSLPGRHFEMISFANTFGVATDYVLSLTQPTTTLFFLAYLNSFDPANVATNYLGDAGGSAASTSFSVTVPAGATVFVVIHEVNVNGGLGANFSVTVDVLAVPEPGTWAAGLLIVGLTGFRLFRRRPARILAAT